MLFRRAIIAAFLIVVGVTTANAQQVIKAAYEVSQRPLMWINGESFQPTGPLVELFEAIAKDQDFKIEWHTMIPADRVAFHNAKIVDLSLGQYAPERAGTLDFADVVYTVGDALYVRKADSAMYRTMEDLRDRIVTSPAGGGLTEQMQKASAGIVKEFRALVAPANFDAVRSGAAHAGFLNNISLVERVRAMPDLRIVTTWESRVKNPGGFMLNKGQEQLLAKINASLVKLKANGAALAIFEKHGMEIALAR